MCMLVDIADISLVPYSKPYPTDLIQDREDWFRSLNLNENMILLDYSNGHPSRVKKAGHNADIEYLSMDIVYDRDDGICYLCGTKVEFGNWHLDHLTPLSRGGSHTYTNVAVTHSTCNLSKGAKTPEEYWDWLDVTSSRPYLPLEARSCLQSNP